MIEPINTRDIPGFFLNRQDVAHQTVQTIGAEVVDTFYVRTRAGELVTSTPHRKEIQKALLHAVT